MTINKGLKTEKQKPQKCSMNHRKRDSLDSHTNVTFDIWNVLQSPFCTFTCSVQVLSHKQIFFINSFHTWTSHLTDLCKLQLSSFNRLPNSWDSCNTVMLFLGHYWCPWWCILIEIKVIHTVYNWVLVVNSRHNLMDNSGMQIHDLMSVCMCM